MEKSTAEYPKYYRKENHCVKRTGDTTSFEILVPVPGKLLPLSLSPSTYPSKQRMEEQIAGMQACSEEDYDDFLGTFFAGARELDKPFNDKRQKAFEAGLLKLSISFSIIARQFLQI